MWCEDARRLYVKRLAIMTQPRLCARTLFLPGRSMHGPPVCGWPDVTPAPLSSLQTNKVFCPGAAVTLRAADCSSTTTVPS